MSISDTESDRSEIDQCRARILRQARIKNRLSRNPNNMKMMRRQNTFARRHKTIQMVDNKRFQFDSKGRVIDLNYHSKIDSDKL